MFSEFLEHFGPNRSAPRDAEDRKVGGGREGGGGARKFSKRRHGYASPLSPSQRMSSSGSGVYPSPRGRTALFESSKESSSRRFEREGGDEGSGKTKATLQTVENHHRVRDADPTDKRRRQLPSPHRTPNSDSNLIKRLRERRMGSVRKKKKYSKSVLFFISRRRCLPSVSGEHPSSVLRPTFSEHLFAGSKTINSKGADPNSVHRQTVLANFKIFKIRRFEGLVAISYFDQNVSIFRQSHQINLVMR